MRVDRFITLGVSKPLIDVIGVPRSDRIPILMYHSISDAVDTDSRPYFRTVTTPESFTQHMQYIRDSGYEVVTLTEAAARLRDWRENGSWLGRSDDGSADDRKSPRRVVVVTFDDGFRDFHGNAFPIMERFGFKGSVFLSTDYIGRNFVTGRPCLHEYEIRELSSEGIEFGSHTVSHPQLRNCSMDQLAREISESQKKIEDVLGKSVSTFSYPYRFPEEDSVFVDSVGQLLAERGYQAGVTTVIGTAAPGDLPLFMPRLPLNDCDDVRLLDAKLIGAYDWLHTGQLAVKRFRRFWRKGA